MLNRGPAIVMRGKRGRERRRSDRERIIGRNRRHRRIESQALHSEEKGEKANVEFASEKKLMPLLCCVFTCRGCLATATIGCIAMQFRVNHSMQRTLSFCFSRQYRIANAFR